MPRSTSIPRATPQVDLGYERSSDGTLRVALRGEWKLASGIPAPEGVVGEIEKRPLPRKVAFDAASLAGWDSSLVMLLRTVVARCAELGVKVDDGGLPAGVRGLLALATAVPAKVGGRRDLRPRAVFARVGDAALASWRAWLETLDFIGDAFLSLVRLFAGKARFRRSDFLLLVQDCGPRSLPIVTLVTLLVGLVLAFVGAIQLRLFGAQIYVADLVGIGMVREIGAIMTGVIVTGRTGASFAAHLGTMQVNEEIDALRTLGLPPMDFLVLPRILALTLMMPLLCVYADIVGMVGGGIVAVAMLDINPLQYVVETKRSVHVDDVCLGLFMSAVFGVLIALAGCMRGLASGRSASAVGEATTSAVVTGIVSIVVATAIITVIAHVLGI